MNFLGVQEIKIQTTMHIHNELDAEFMDTVKIISDEKGKLLVIPNNLYKNPTSLFNLF